MSGEIVLVKAPDGFLIPADEQSAEALRTIKIGQGITIKYSKYRNIGHHRKYWALLNLAFDAWTPQAEYKGEKVQKNFQQFRNDIICLAGFHETVVTMRGEVRVRARSISFASMSQDEFSELYSKTIDVVLQRILTNYKKSDLENVINQVLGFT